MDSAIKKATPRDRLWRRVRPVLRQMGAHWQLYLLALPAVLYILLFVYKPMYGILIAFKNFSPKLGIMGSEWVGLGKFMGLFRSTWFPIIIRNTLTLSVMSLIFGFPLPILLALMVNEIRSEKLKRTFQTVSYAPHFISTVVMCGMVLMFLSPTSGVINVFIKALGGEAVSFMQETSYFKWIYLISGIWQGTGWGAIIYFAALSGVDQSLLEAADIDGASRFQKIIYINFPVLVPTIVIMFILNCGSLLNVGYEKVYALQNSPNLPSSEVISTYVYKIGLQDRNYSLSTATNLFNSVVNSTILILANLLSKRVAKTSLW